MNGKNINLHIDRIVLNGVGRLNRDQLNQVIQKELHRLITTQGVHSLMNQSKSIKQVSAQPINLTSQIKERRLGNQIAGAVYRGLKR